MVVLQRHYSARKTLVNRRIGKEILVHPALKNPSVLGCISLNNVEIF
jgi:hypothetical protein